MLRKLRQTYSYSDLAICYNVMYSANNVMDVAGSDRPAELFLIEIVKLV